MEPIEEQIAERKALLKQWALEIQSLEAPGADLSDEEKSKAQLRIAQLGYKISCGEFALKDLEEILSERDRPKPTRPPLPKARRLSEPERKRIERETIARIRSDLKLTPGYEVHVHVGRVTDEHGEPQISISVGPVRRFDRE